MNKVAISIYKKKLEICEKFPLVPSRKILEFYRDQGEVMDIGFVKDAIKSEKEHWLKKIISEYENGKDEEEEEQRSCSEMECGIILECDPKVCIMRDIGKELKRIADLLSENVFKGYR